MDLVFGAYLFGVFAALIGFAYGVVVEQRNRRTAIQRPLTAVLTRDARRA